MATIDAAIPAGADDVALDDNGFDVANGYPVLGRAGATDCVYAFRVPVSGLAGATITAAYIDNVNQANGGNASPTLAIYAEDAESPARITSLNDLNARTRTTAKVDWDAAWTGYNTKDSPSITSIIQELADTYNPDYIQIFIQNDGGSAGVQVYAYEGEAPPTLHIEYTAGSSGITGTLSATIAVPTITAVGAVAVAGALSATVALPTLSASGGVAVAGALSATIPTPVLVATGAVAIAGSLDATIPAPSIVATGTVEEVASAHGALDAVIAAPSIVAAGAVVVSGAANNAIPVPSLTATGAALVAGTLNATIPAPTLLAILFIGVVTTPASRTNTPGYTSRSYAPGYTNRVHTPAARYVDEPDAVDRTGD